MNANAAEVRALVLDVLDDLRGPGDPGPSLLDRAWRALGASDLVLVGVPEDQGGSGGGLADAAAVLAATAEAGLSLPLVETTWAVATLTSLAGRPAPTTRATYAVAGPDLPAGRHGDHWRVDGTAAGVPWGDQADEFHLVLPTGTVLVVPLEPGDHETAVGLPATDLDLTGHPVADAYELGAPVGEVLAEVAERVALARAVQIGGACRSALDLAVQYAGERVQFGRSLSKYQVIQHQLAVAASRTHAVNAAVDAAVEAVAAGASDSVLAVRAAKAVASEAVEQVSAIAHQVLGAIGTTREHQLHRRTMSMWAWRDAAGDEYVQAESLAAEALLAGADVWAHVAPLSEAVR
jgi:acyl-CoA dehydrogenase